MKNHLTSVNSNQAILGTMQTLAKILKYAPRTFLVNNSVILNQMMDFVDTSKQKEFWRNTLIRKEAAKIIQRVGLVFLKPKLASWRYQRGEDYLMHRNENVGTKFVE